MAWEDTAAGKKLQARSTVLVVGAPLNVAEWAAQEPPDKMKTRIYVGNLAYAATANDIRKLFSPFGEVAAAHVFTAGINGLHSCL